MEMMNNFFRGTFREGPIRAHHVQMKSQFISEVSRILTSLFAGEILARKESIDESLGEHFTLNICQSQLICQDEIYDFDVLFFFQIENKNHAGFWCNWDIWGLRRFGFFGWRLFSRRIFVPPSIRRRFFCVEPNSAHLGALLPWRSGSGRHVKGVWRSGKCRGLGDWPCGIKLVNSWANWGRMLLWKGT